MAVKAGWKAFKRGRWPVLAKQRKNHTGASRRRDRGVYRPFRRRSEVGGLPGRVGEHEESLPTIVSYMSFDQSTFEEREGLDSKAIQQLVDRRGHVTWIDVVGFADTKIIELIGQRYNIHPLLLEDVVHTHQRPKVEIHDGRVALILRMVSASAPFRSEQVSFVLSGSTVITFQEHQGGDAFEPVRRRIRHRLGTIRSAGADYTMYSLIDAVIDGFFPLLEDYGRELEELEDAIDTGVDESVQQRVHTIRSELSRLRKIAWSHREALQRMVTDAADMVDAATIPFLRDCLDHTGQVLDVAETFREVAGDMRDLYFTQLSHRTNEVVKFLTIISTIFMPLSFIAGLYGMNFNAAVSPYNMPETQWRFGYPMAIVIMALTSAAMLGYFYRKGWLWKG